MDQIRVENKRGQCSNLSESQDFVLEFVYLFVSVWPRAVNIVVFLSRFIMEFS